MKKIKTIICLAMICVLFGACAPKRQADKQLKDVPYLHAAKMQILDASGQEIRLASKRFTITDVTTDRTAIIDTLQEERYNSITLDLNGALIDDSALPWKLRDEAETMIDDVMQKCHDAEKYLLIDISEYPKSYYAWYDDSDFKTGVVDVWKQLAEKMASQPYFGAYVLSGLPRTGSAEERTALSFFEEALQTMCDGIRQHDTEHMIAVGAISPYVKDEDAFHGFPLIHDPNFAYCIYPQEMDFFTEQTRADDRGCEHLTYPSTYLITPEKLMPYEEITGSDVNFSSIQYQTRATKVFKIEDEQLFARIGVSVKPPDVDGGGELRVWTVHFAECDQDGKELKVLYDTDTTVDIPFMSIAGSGVLDEGSVYEDDGSAYLESIKESTFFYIKDLNIPVEKGKYYQLTVTMKQRGMNKDFSCAPAVGLYERKEIAATFDASFVQQYYDTLFAEAEQVGVPLIYEGIGTTAPAQGRGGEQYVQDVKNMILQQQQHYIER